jgi:tRNA pseudouridine55 synthase
VEGIIVVNKPSGISSHGIVARIRKLAPGVKVGHAGTLDPAATGVLPVCLGKATRISEYVMDHPKGYRAAVELGVTTDTEDAQGTVLEERAVPALNDEQIKKILHSLTGVQEQLPPVYSAVKYRGQPLYRWTRQGKTVPRSKRSVQIYRLELCKYDPAGGPHLFLEVECSRGTYIRTLAVEIGRRIGCGGHLWALERYFVGPFTLAFAATPEQLQSAKEQGELQRFLLPMDRALTHLPAITADPATITALRHGRRVTREQLTLAASAAPSGDGELLRVYDYAGCFKALARWRDEGATAVLETVKYLATEEG